MIVLPPIRLWFAGQHRDRDRSRSHRWRRSRSPSRRGRGTTDRRFAYPRSVLVLGRRRGRLAGRCVVDVAHRDLLGGLWIALTAATPLVPGIAAAGPVGFKEFERDAGRAACSVPPSWHWPAPHRCSPLFAGGRLALWPLAALAHRDRAGRPLHGAAVPGWPPGRPCSAISSSPPPRPSGARLAADIHDDDALQVNDSAGSPARGVAATPRSGDRPDRRRQARARSAAICACPSSTTSASDLPSTGWFSDRAASPAARSASSRPDDARHAPEVELAIFRVAQEALANAVKARPAADRGSRYRSTDGGISLVDRATASASPTTRQTQPSRRGDSGSEHGPAGRADRGNPRRPALAGRWNPRGARVAAALTGGSAAAIRLLIVDDHPVAGRAPPRSWRPSPGSRSPGTAGSIDEARASIEQAPADVVLLDIRLGPDSGLRLLTREDQTQAIHPGVIVLTAYDYSPVRGGRPPSRRASGFRAEDGTDRRASTRSGGSRRAGWRSRCDRPRATAGARLTERELDVVRLVVDGRSNDEIAARSRDRPEDGRITPASPGSSGSTWRPGRSSRPAQLRARAGSRCRRRLIAPSPPTRRRQRRSSDHGPLPVGGRPTRRQPRDGDRDRGVHPRHRDRRGHRGQLLALMADAPTRSPTCRG